MTSLGWWVKLVLGSGGAMLDTMKNELKNEPSAHCSSPEGRAPDASLPHWCISNASMPLALAALLPA